MNLIAACTYTPPCGNALRRRRSSNPLPLNHVATSFVPGLRNHTFLDPAVAPIFPAGSQVDVLVPQPSLHNSGNPLQLEKVSGVVSYVSVSSALNPLAPTFSPAGSDVKVLKSSTSPLSCMATSFFLQPHCKVAKYACFQEFRIMFKI